MKYNKIRKMDIANGPGVRVSIFLQGCAFHCENCFNPETWDFDSGVDFDDKVIDVIQTYYQENKAYNSFKEIENEFKEYIEIAPKDYEINNLEDALKDLGITDDSPKIVKTPYETIQVRARNIEHIINREDDKSRYKFINRMFATLERPNIITLNEDNTKGYFKIFEEAQKSKKQIVYVSTDEQGNFVLTIIPVKRNKKFINAINKGNIIYNSRKGVINNSPDTNIITDNSDNFNPENDNFSRPKTLEEIHEDVRQRAKGMQYLGYFIQYHLYKINSHKFKNVFKFMNVHFRLFYFKLID